MVEDECHSRALHSVLRSVLTLCGCSRPLVSLKCKKAHVKHSYRQ